MTASAASSTVVPGGTDQFTAVVTNSTAAVTWSIPSTAPGSIDSTSGLYTAPNPVTKPGPITVTATLASDSTKTGTATVSVLQLTGLAVSPKGPAIAVGGTKAFTALGTFTNGTSTSTSDWTAESTWTSSTTAATMSGSTATGAALGITTIAATDTASTISGTTVLNVTTGTLTNASLIGSYVFSISHSGTRGQSFSTGAFQSGGDGTITGGVVDFNAPQGSAKDVAISGGSYTIYPDGRGTLSLTAQGTDTYNLILSSDGSHGRLILDANTGVEVGTFEKQTAGTLSGTYTLLLGGEDGTLCTISCSGGSAFQNPIVIAGQFSTLTAGTASGVLDANDNGTLDGVAGGNVGSSDALAFMATYGTPDANGRGTFQLTPPSALGSQAPWNFAYYVVSANKTLLIQTDVQTSPLSTPPLPALAGMAETQSGVVDPAGSNYVFLLERSDGEGLFGTAGQWQFAAPNILLGEMDVNSSGMTNNVSIAGSTYTTVDTTTGRGSVTVSPTRSYIFYTVSSATGAGKMYILEADTKVYGGVGQQQTTTSTLPPGTLAFNLGQLATGESDASYLGVFLTSSMSGIVDSNVAVSGVETQASTLITAGAFGTPDGFGRGTVTFNGLPDQTNTAYGFYIVSPTEIVVFGIPTTAPAAGYQAVDGLVEVQ